VDDQGNTALMLGVKRLMHCGLFKRAYQFAVIMLKFGSDVNWLNNGGRSLITYTVHYMDQAIDITRLLLNSGATVWVEGKKMFYHSASNFGDFRSRNSARKPFGLPN